MTNLIKIELKKIFKTPNTKICFLALIIIMIGVVINEYQDISAFRSNEAYKEEVMSWREREETIIKFASESLEDDWYNDLQKEQIRRRIAISEYRLKNNIDKDIYKNMWWFFNDKFFNVVSTIAIIMIMIIGSNNIAGEYSGNTLRQVLLLPYKRWKILISKLIAIILIGIMLYSVVFGLGILSGVLLHGTSRLSSSVVLYFGNKLITMNMGLYSIVVILLKLVEIVFYSVLLMFISVITKNTSASMLITGATVVFSVPISNFLSSYYSLINYLPFLNLDFRRYLDFGTTMPEIESFFGNFVVEGITPLISIAIIGLTLLLLVALSLEVFNKQDI